MSFLYKYRPFNKDTLKTLALRKLFFSRPAFFNDPFDSQLSPEEFARELNTEGITHGTKRIEMSSSFMDRCLRDAGILCLSKKNENILMWSHYADSHRGLCIGFTEDLLEDLNTSNEGQEFSKYEVSYDTNHPFLDIQRDILYGHKYGTGDAFIDQCTLEDDLLEASISKKHQHWIYEDEVRFYTKSYGLYEFSPSSVDHIIFGMNASLDDIETVRNILKTEEWSHVELLNAHRKPCALELEIPVKLA
ncbi:DUF2971 domain-containing protein [Pelagicoccus sp. NFK12]|uniref:DUF2971 domain-containing protein n=2 Tax=Pelagicoccus enzymogenes TaxID=2773457 RepID=A0A927IJH7_9BACT|nr:DUF2971 domain-containing protein [Pelagicoccus enzymogenes]